MKKTIFGVNLLLASAVFAGNYFYMSAGGAMIKYLASGGFALMGIINLLYALINKTVQPKFCISMSVGLVFAMLGDILLGYDFVIGASLFAIGHVCYLAAYCMLEKLKKLDLLISGVLFAGAGSYLLFCPLLQFPDEVKKYVCLAYALIISMMVGKALGNVIRNRNPVTVILAIGSILFFFSDLMLVFDWFMNIGDIAGELCMATYYPAECLLAFSIFTTDYLKGSN